MSHFLEECLSRNLQELALDRPVEMFELPFIRTVCFKLAHPAFRPLMEACKSFSDSTFYIEADVIARKMLTTMVTQNVIQSYHRWIIGHSDIIFV